MQIFIIMGLLVRILTVLPAMAGLGVTIALIPASTWLARKTAAIRKVCALFRRQLSKPKQSCTPEMETRPQPTFGQFQILKPVNH